MEGLFLSSQTFTYTMYLIYGLRKWLRRIVGAKVYMVRFADDLVCCFQSESEAESNCKGKGKPPTFDFLGFTHFCSKSRKAKYRVKRKTSRKKTTATLKSHKQ